MSDRRDRNDRIAQRRAGNIEGEKFGSGSFGQRALETMGWSEGRGVGVREGRTDPLKVKRLREGGGLGAGRDEVPSDAWIESVSGYEQVLSKLNKTFNEVVEEEEGEGDNDRSGGSEEEKKKKKKKSKKKSKKEKKDKKGETKTETVVKQSVGVISQKRLRAKNMQSFSREDLAAIMGGTITVVKEEVKVVEEPIFNGMFVKATKN